MNFSFSKWLKQIHTSSRSPIRRKQPQRKTHELQGITYLEDRTLPTTLGALQLVEGPSGAKDSVMVMSTGSWSASTSDAWLHTSSTGSGNGIASFTYDANTGPTRTGMITIDGQQLAVTQAGSGYTAAGLSQSIVSGLAGPTQLAMDSTGNIYIADTILDRIVKYNVADGTYAPLPIPGLDAPYGVAVDAQGNVYIGDTYNAALKKYDPIAGTTTTLATTFSDTPGGTQIAFGAPSGITVDASGNVYISDYTTFRLQVYQPSTGQAITVLNGYTDPVSINRPYTLTMDAAGSLYMVDAGLRRIAKYDPATKTTSSLVSSGYVNSGGISADGRGNLYFSDVGNKRILMYSPSTNGLTTITNTADAPGGVVVTPSGDVIYDEGTYGAGFRILPNAYVSTTPIAIPNSIGGTSIPIVAANPLGVSGALAPTSSASWLTVVGVTPAGVDLSYTTNTGITSRTATVSVLGQTITVTQDAAGKPTMGTTTASNITSNSALINGTVLTDGNNSLTSRGILYAPTSINANPTLGGTGVIKVDDTATAVGSFGVNATGLTPGTNYSVVAYATNGVGTAYSPVATFVTLPTVQFTSPTQSTPASSGTFNVPVVLSSPSPVDVTVPFSVSGTAVNGVDYTGLSASPLVIPAGQTTGIITGTLIDRGYQPTNPTIIFSIGSPTNADSGVTTVNTMSIVSAALPTVQFGTASQTVPAENGTFSIPVTLSAPSTTDTTIVFSLSGTAVSGTDYSNVTGSPLVIPAGQTSGVITGNLIANPSASTSPVMTFTMGAITNGTPGSVITSSLTITEPAPLLHPSIDVGGLEFKDAIGFSLNNNIYTASGPVQVGFTPASGQSFVALLTLASGVSIDATAKTITSQGQVQSIINSTPTTLLTAGLTGASIAALTGAGLTGLSGQSFTVASMPFTLSTLALSNSGTNGPQVLLQGRLELPYGLSVDVAGTNHVIINSTSTTLTGASATVPSQSFSLSGVAFSGLTLTANYNQPTDTMVLTGGGNATFTTPNGNVVVDLSFGQGTMPGLSFTAGSLTTFDAAVTSNFTVGGVAFSAQSLNLTYAKTTSIYSLAGTASVAVTGMGALGVTFGHGTTPGLVVTNGALTSLDATVNSTFTVAGVTFTTQDLDFSYASATNQFALAGTATVAVNNMGNMDVTFGHGTTPGLVVTNGSLVSLDTTVNTSFTVKGVTFTANDLELKYTASNSQYALLGTAAIAIASLGKFGVTFGHGTTPGLVVTNGSLVSLDTTVNSDITVSGVTITATDLEFKYTAANSTFSMLGAAEVNVTNIGKVAVAFGHGTTPGLVVTNGTLSSLDMTVNSSFTVAGVTITATDLEFKYTAANSTFALAGTAAVSVRNMGDLGVTFGHGTTPGLVITNGSMVSLDMTVNSSFTVAGVTITAKDLEFKYTAANSTFALAGTAAVSVRNIGDISVTFGHGTTPGLVVTSGTLSSLDMTVNASFTVAAVTITATDLEFKYTAANNTFALTGTAAVNVTNIGKMAVTFGHGTTPGLVVTNGSLSSLDMTVNSSFTVAGVTITATDLEFKYTAADSTFALTGGAKVSVRNIGDIGVTFGHGTTPGLVVTNGSLVSLDMTVNASFDVAGVSITAKDLEFKYTAANSQFSMLGTAGVNIKRLGNLDVTFGHGTTPGLVITSGSLTSLDMTVNANFTVAKVTITAKDLEFTYDAASNKFTLAGTASAAVLNLGNLSVTFGDGTKPGLVVTNGSLDSLDMTINAGFSVASVVFTVKDLHFTYTAADSQFTLSGTASINIKRIGDISVKFGYTDPTTNVTKPGLVVTDGSLQYLDITLDTDITLGGVTIRTKGLEFTYTAATSQYTLAGTASLSVTNIGDISVKFGYTDPVTKVVKPGLVITNGTLDYLDVTLDTNISVAKVTITTKGLNFTYTAATNQYTLAGTAGLSITGLGNLSVKFGYTDPVTHAVMPGLVITNGSLKKLDLTLDSKISVKAVTFETKGLRFSYDADTSTYALYGSAGVTVTGIGSLTVKFGYTDSATHISYPGLLIVNGELQKLDMTIDSKFRVKELEFFTKDLRFTYTPSTGVFTLSGTAGVTIAKIGEVSVTFGHGTTPGLVITNGTLENLDVTIATDVKFANISFGHADLELIYTRSLDLYVIRGKANVNLGVQTFSVELGDGSLSRGIVIQNGNIVSVYGTISTTFGVAGFSIGTVSLTLSYDAATDTFDFKGTADLTLTASPPGFFSTFIKLKSLSLHLGRVDFAVHYVGGHDDASYASASVSMAGYNVGLKVWFDHRVEVTGISDAIVQGIQDAINEAARKVEEAALAAARAAEAAALAAKVAAKEAASIAQAGTTYAADTFKAAWNSFCVFDNQIAGGTVFFDTNMNGVLDAGEYNSTTAADGTFSLEIPEGLDGQWVAFGGMNVATNLPNTMVMTAPKEARKISPLSTLVQSVRAANPGVSVVEASSVVTSVLGIPNTVDILNTDVVGSAISGNADAAKAFTSAVEIANLVNGIKATLGSNATGTTDLVGTTIFTNLGKQLMLSSGKLDMTDENVVKTLIQNTADQSGITLDSSVVSGAATVLAGVNRYMESTPVAGGTDYMKHVVQAQIVAGNNVDPLLRQVSAGAANIDTVVAQYTGDAFAAAAVATPVGALAASVSNSSSILAVGASSGGGPRVRVIDRLTNNTIADFFAFESTFTGGTSVAVGDVNANGVADIVVAAGAGGGPRVRVIDGTKLEQIAQQGLLLAQDVLADFFAFEPTFTGGTHVALGHLSDSLGLDIVIGAGAGGGPRVRTFSYKPEAAGNVSQLPGYLGDFFAFDPSVRSGVNVAAGDLDGSGRDSLIVGAGVGEAPVVAVFDATGGLRNQFLAYDPSMRNGVTVAAGYMNGTQNAQILTGSGPGASSAINVYDVYDTSPMRSFSAFEPNFTGGLKLASSSVNGRSDIIVGSASAGSQVSVLSPYGEPAEDPFFAFEPSFHGGVVVG